MIQLQIVGGGRMGEALLGGVLSSGWAPGESIRVVESDTGRRETLEQKYPGVEVTSELGEAVGTVIAVKPAAVGPVIRDVVACGGGRLVSIAAGVTLAQLQAAAGPGAVVIRAMPNTPALVLQAATAIAAGSSATEPDLDWAESLLGAIGTVVRVTEAQIDAVTGLSGSGPAYVFLIAESLIEAGVLAGLPRDLAATLANQTLLGAATLLSESSESPADLRAAVTSPGGTTAAGLRVLEQRGVRAALIDTVIAARDRSVEMSS
jgi:pyrroline-5-carboxylate reductase